MEYVNKKEGWMKIDVVFVNVVYVVFHDCNRREERERDGVK